MVAPRSRHQERERALELLYEADRKSVTPADVLGELPVAPGAFVSDLVLGVEANREDIDSLVETSSIDWRMDRMAVVDKVVLRIATYELLKRLDIPTAAVISEAVELAKVYSTEESGRFVNGVLAAIATAVRPAQNAPDELTTRRAATAETARKEP